MFDPDRKRTTKTTLHSIVFFFIFMVFMAGHLGDARAHGGTPEETRSGELIRIRPGPSFQIPENSTFNFQFTYSPGQAALPPGSYFEFIMPQNPMLSPLNTTRPKIVLNTRKYPTGLYLKIDPFFSSQSVKTPGCGEKIDLILEKGLETDESFILDMPITVTYALYNHYDPVATVNVRITLHPGDGLPPRPIKSPDWPIVPLEKKRLLISCPSQAGPGEKIPVVVYFAGLLGRSVREKMGQVWIEPMENMEIYPEGPVTVLKKDAGRQALEVAFSRPGVYRLTARAENGLTALGNPVMVGPKKWENVYWGNLHAHTNYSWDQRNWFGGDLYPEAMINEARDCYLLDFIAITDHGQHNVMIRGLHFLDPGMPSGDMPPEDWKSYKREILGNKRTDIIAYLGYEHRDRRGDTVMVYRNDAPYFNKEGRRAGVRQIWAASPPGDLISIPHLHPQKGIDLFQWSSPHETLVEITSGHGSFEHYQCLQPGMPWLQEKPKVRSFTKHVGPKGPFVRDLLDFGKRFGIVASEDHGYPGNMGITGLFCPEKEHNALFDSLLARKTFATTGARMIIYLNGEGLLMGQEMAVAENSPIRRSRRFQIEVYGTDRIQSIEMIRNGKIIHRDEVDAMDYQHTYIDHDPLDEIAVRRPVDRKRTAYYYLRVIQKDGHLGWSSPVFFILPEDGPK